MAFELKNLKEYINIFGRGLVLESAPRVAGGMISELCHGWGMDKGMITEWVQNNVSLWSRIDPEQQRDLAVLADVLGGLDFLTPEVVINGIKKDFPLVASLLVNWPEGVAWLDRQIEELKGGIKSGDNRGPSRGGD